MTPSSLLAATIAVMMTVAAAFAKDGVPEDNRTCFCLEKRAGRELLNGCRAFRRRGASRPTAICWDPKREKATPSFPITDEWSFIRGDSERCAPCEPERAEQTEESEQPKSTSRKKRKGRTHTYGSYGGPRSGRDAGPRVEEAEPTGADATAPTPSRPAHWNAWVQQGAAPVASDALAPRQHYTFFLNLAGYDFSRLRTGAVGSVEADPAVQELLRTTQQAEISIVIRPVLVGRSLRFANPADVERTMKVTLHRLQATDEHAPDIDRYVAGEIGPAELSSAVSAGQIRFDLNASAQGCAAIALSIWSADGLFPLDHLVHSVRVGASGATNCDADASQAQAQPLRGGLATLLETTFSLTKQAGTTAAAALHVFETSSGNIAVFVDGRRDRPRKVYSWVLVSNIINYLGSPDGLAKVVEGARKRAADGQSGSYVEAANELSLKLFSGQDEGDEIASQAKAALQSVVAEAPAPPVIVARIASSQLTNGRNRTAILPLGLLAAKGQGAILSKPITVVQPLPRERYSSGQTCISPWAFGIPNVLDGIDPQTNDALAKAKAPDAPGQWFQSLGELKAYLADRAPRQAPAPEGLLILAHQGSGQLWFADRAQRIQPEEIRRSFEPGSVAVFAACSTASPNENNAAVLERLNDRGIDGMIASPFPVPAQFGVRFALEFVATVRDERLAHRTPTLAQIFVAAMKRTADQLAAATGGGEFEEMALEYVLLGDPNVTLCAQAEGGARP